MIRTNLIRKALPFVHMHLGAPPGFGKTTLLHQLHSHFMRGGKTARKGLFLDAARDPLRSHCAALWPPLEKGLWIVAVDNLSLADQDALSGLLSRIENLPDSKMRLFTAGPPLSRPLAPHRAAGTTLELGMEELAFSAEEIRALSPSCGEEVRALTKGWPLPTVYLAMLPPHARTPALDDANSELRTWMREQVLAPWKGAKNDLLLRGATLDCLSSESVPRLGPPQTIMEHLRTMVREGCPLLREGKSLRMHPFMRRCLLADLDERPDSEAEWDRTIRFHKNRGDLLQAARAAFEAGRPAELADILAGLESFIHRIFDPVLKKEFGIWLNCVAAWKGELPSRTWTLMARYKNMTGEPRAAQKLAENAVQSARREGDIDATLRGVLLVARILRCRSSLEESDRLLEALLAEFPAMNRVLRYSVCAELAYNRILQSDYRGALALMSDLKEKAALEKHPSALWAERFMTIPLFYLGRYTEALACFRAAENLPYRQQQMLDRHGIHIVAAKCLQIKGHFPECAALVRQQLTMKTLADDSDDRWMSLILAAEIEFGEQEPDLQAGKGDLSRMADYLEQARALFSENLENAVFQAWYQAYRRIPEAFAAPENMRAILRDAVREAHDCSPFLYGMLLLRSSAWRLAVLEDWENLPEIVAMLHECIEVCGRTGCEVFASLAHATLAAVYGSLALRERAKKHLITAFAHFEREDEIGLFRSVAEMTPFVRMAWEEELAPEFVSRVVQTFGYRLKKWKVKLFGRFEITPLPGETPTAINRSRVREMFAWLIHNGGRTVTRREMALALWPGASYDNTARLCSVTLSQLRVILRRIGLDDALSGRRGVYRMDTSGLILDSDGLENLEEVRAMLPMLAGKGEKLQEEFDRLRLTPLREGYLGEFETPWAREAAREIDARICRLAREKARQELPTGAWPGAGTHGISNTNDPAGLVASRVVAFSAGERGPLRPPRGFPPRRAGPRGQER